MQTCISAAHAALWNDHNLLICMTLCELRTYQHSYSAPFSGTKNIASMRVPQGFWGEIGETQFPFLFCSGQSIPEPRQFKPPDQPMAPAAGSPAAALPPQTSPYPHQHTKCFQLARISVPTKTAQAALSLPAELRMQPHQPLRQRLGVVAHRVKSCLLYTSPSPRD